MAPAPPRLPLCCLPTPLHRLDRLSADWGVDLWIKRDDLTGFAGGGNKGRKLEYLIARSVAEGTQTIVTCGSVQSNFVRQLAAACAVVGIRCVAVLMARPYEATIGRPEGEVPDRGGNLVLDALFGADLRVLPDGPWETLFTAADDVGAELRAAGVATEVIAVGGSSPLGAYAFWIAGGELVAEDAPEFDAIVVPTSSGSTHAGLAARFADTGTRVIGIACDPEEDLLDDLHRLGRGLGELTGRPSTAGYDLRFDYVGPGYGVPTAAGRDATLLAARREGVILDPVYGAKAFAGMHDLIRRGELSGRVLYWHTGGLPSLFVTDESASRPAWEPPL